MVAARFRTATFNLYCPDLNESILMFRFLTALPLLALLGACSSQMEITKPPVAYKTLKQLPANTYRGDAKTTVRTKAKTKNGSSELSGVDCVLATPYTETQFQTPAHVMTPNLGPATPMAHLKCNYDNRAVQENMQPINVSLNERSQQARSSGAGAGIIGAVVSGIAAGINESKGDQPGDIHGYYPVNLDMGSVAAPAAK